MARTRSSLPANTIILGFTGTIGSGCTYIAEAIEHEYKYKYFSLSDILRNIAAKKGLNNPSVDDLQTLGNNLRAKYGNSYLVQELLKFIKKGDLPGLKSDKGTLKGIIIDSIRNDGEVYTLRQFPYFYLFSVHSGFELRKQRTLRDKKFKSKEEFKNADHRDKAEDIQYGQQVAKCNDLADFIINNDKNIPQRASQEKKKFIDRVYNNYVLLVEHKQEGVILPDNLPTTNETLMTMAYAESQRSSCLKRKVGAIIAEINHSSFGNGSDNRINESVNIISSGHNEVPLGSIPCAFNPEYEKCYRDHLQEEHAKKIKFCPNCGEEIKLSSQKCKKCKHEIKTFIKVCPDCKNEIDVQYKCPKCDKEVFKEYLIGAGKLLDMCKALHAEENALLSLKKHGGENFRNTVLYTTTFPCNLCANKIVASGINKVVYADPYPMKEAKTILAAGKVEIEKFEGIKSSAYFKLYNV